MARPVGAVDASQKRTYGGTRRGSHHVLLPYLGEPSRKLEGESIESCDSEEEEELDGTRNALCVPCEARKGSDSLPTPGCRPLVEVQTTKGIEAVKPATVTRSRPPLPDNPSQQQQENLGIPAPLSAHRRQHPTPTLSHRGNAQHAVLAHKFATDGNVPLNNASALDSSLSCSAVELERHRLPPSSAQPHSTALAGSSRRQQPTGILKREAATRPTPELPHCSQGGGGRREEVVGHLRRMQEERPVVPPGPDLRSKDWLALPDINRKKWVLKVSHLGRGGFSEVLKVLSVEDREMYALKVVSLTNSAMEEALANEVRILKKLQGHPQIVQLKEFFLDRDASKFYILLELGSMDLTQVIRKKREHGCWSLWMRTLWYDMLLAVKAIHDQSIVHSDLKPANFLMVGSQLKLIDFGISNKLQDDCTSVLKDLRCGTFNYMAPEMLETQDKEGEIYKVGRYSDVWSLGCILYLMVYGKTPFQDITNHMQKFFAIVSPTYQISYPPHSDHLASQVIKSCLQRSPKARPTAAELLKHSFITGFSQS